MNRTPILIAACCLLAATLSPAVGAWEAEYKLKELKGVAPDWWTPEMAAKADAAAAEGKLLNPLTGETFTPREAAAILSVPVGAPDYLFVRPGALFLGQSGALCTYNFVYDAHTKIGVAGHCVERNGERVYILSTPAPTFPLLTSLGSVASFRNGGIGDDWALVNIDAQWQAWVDPAMAYVGGPSCPAWNGMGGLVKHAGHGIQTGVVASVPRVSRAYPTFSGDSHFSGIGEISGGDSGSGMILATGPGCALGTAAGVVTHCASLTGLDCLPIFYATDIRFVPATVTVTSV